MTEQTWVALIAFIGTITGGGFLYGVVALYRWRRRDNATTSKEETEAVQNLEQLVNSVVSEKVRQTKELIKAEADKASLAMQLEVANSVAARYEENFKQIFIEQGRAQEREKSCKKELADLRQAFENFETRHSECNVARLER